MAREWARLDNHHSITFMAFRALVMRHIPLTPTQPLAVELVLDQTLDLNHHGLGHLGRYDRTFAPLDPLPHRLSPCALLQLRGSTLLIYQRQDARQFQPCLMIITAAFKLISAQLESQLENLLAGLAFLDTQVGGAHLSEFIKLQRLRPPVPPSRS